MNKTVTETPASAGSKAKPQPARERNIAEIVAFFESGIKDPGTHGKLGIELEHTIVHDDMTPVSYSGPDGTARLLEELSAEYPDVARDAEGDILGVARAGEAVTIEPAAQLELSAGPFDDLGEAQRVFEAFERTVAQKLSARGERLLTVGYHPTAPARSLELIPKRRYDFMNRYLGKKDTFGPCMMRGSASTQVSIDYTSVEDCLRKLRLAYALVPVLSLATDNAPAFEGKPRTHQLVRTAIWQHVDNDRCGLMPGALDTGYTLRRCAEYVLDTPAILVPDEAEQWRYTEETFGEVYAEHPMARADVEHALSMFFPDVRLKTYVEIRPADSMPVPYVIAYAALVKGLFYSPASLDALDRLFAGIDAEAYCRAKDDLMAHGYEATVYGRPVAELCDAVLEVAEAGLGADDRERLRPLAELMRARTTLACLAEQGA